MKILITGCNGQVGNELMKLCTLNHHEVFGYDLPDLDICNLSEILNKVEKIMPDFVVNCAAYTAVDKAESDKTLAFAVNESGPANLAEATAQYNIPFIHISTDYVFNGEKKESYLETDETCPTSVYGISKLAGEKAVQEKNKNHIIIRTSWVFSPFGHNFVKTMLKLSQERETLKVVADQKGCPTSARSIANVILEIMKKGINGKTGLYHFSQQPPSSWHELASEVVQQARQSGFMVKTREVLPITTEEYPTPAKRPENSVLNCEKVYKTFNINPSFWKESIKETLSVLH